MPPTDVSEAHSFGPSAQQHPTPRLHELALLRDFPEKDRLALEEAGTSGEVIEGERVITEGAGHGAILIVLAGRFLVSRGDERIAEIGVGQICGEMEMLNPPHSMASVTAMTPARVWKITRAQLRAFMEAHPWAGSAFMRLLTSTFAARLEP